MLVDEDAGATAAAHVLDETEHALEVVECEWC